MKKCLLLFLCVQLFCGNLFFAELLKFYSLFRHFQHHLEIHKDVANFSDFIYLHYLEDSTEQSKADDEDNQELPFKHDQHHCLHSYSAMVALIPLTQQFTFMPPSPPVTIPGTITIQINNTSLSSIWQPPKHYA